MIESQPVRILLVEDDEVDRMAVERLFAKESLPYDLVVATTVAEATSRLREGGIGLVLIDHRLPDGSGLDVQKEAARTPSIFITGAGDLSVAVEAMKAGAADFLVKDGERQYLQLLPLTIESTLKQAENVRARRRAEEALQRAHDELEAKVRQRTAELTSTVDGLSEEIGHRKQVEEALRESEQKHRTLIENASDAIFVVNGKGQYVEANKKACQMLGYSEEEFLCFDIRDIAAPDQLDVVLGYFDELLQRGRMSHTFDVIAKDRRRLTLELNAVGLENGTYLGIGRDITQRRRAEEELRQFKSIVSSSNDMLALLDKDFVYLTANEAYLRAFGKTSDELVGHTVSEIFGEEFFEKTIRPNAERCLAGEEVHYQNWVDFPIHGRQYMDVAYFPFFGLDKEVKGFVARGQDITERKRAEEMISESERRFRDFFEKTPIGLHIFAPDQTIIDINDAELDMIGYSREEIVGKKKWQDIVIFAQREKFQEHWQEMITQGQVRDLEYTLVHKQGCHIDVILNASSRFNENGNLINTRGSVLNITERRRTEKQIEDLARFPSENPHPVMRVGADGTVLYANAASRPLLDSLDSGVGKVLPADWCKRNVGACGSDSERQIDVTHEERIFSFHVVPVRGAGYSNWYGRDVTERSRAEEELRKSNANLAAAQEIAHLGSFEWNVGTGEVASSDELFRIYGLEKTGEAIPFDTIMELIHTADAPKIEEFIKRMLEGEPLPPIEYRAIRPDGTERILVVDRTVEFDASGKPVKMVGTVQDITERKRADQALRESEEKLRVVTDATADFVMLLDGEFRVQFTNHVALGLSRKEVIGTPLYTFAEGEDIPKVRDHLETVLRTGKKGRYETIYHRRDGQVVYFESLAVPLLDGGSEERIVVTSRDITERKRAEEALKLNESRLAAMLEMSRMEHKTEQETAEFALQKGVELTNSRIGFIGSLSEGETVMTMYNWSKVVMKECAIEGKPATFHVAEAGLWGEVVRSREPVVVNDCQDLDAGKKGYPRGHMPIIRYLGIPVFDGDRIVLVAGVANKEEDYDQTDVRQLTLLMKGLWDRIRRLQVEEALQKAHDELEERVEARTAALARANEQLYLEMKEREQTEETLHRSQRLASLGTLAAGIAHEINNPLQGITFSAEVAIQKKDLPGGRQRVDEVLGTIKAEAMRCGRIVKSVLQFARQEVSEKWPSSLDDVVRHAADLTSQQAARKQVSVRLDLGESLPLLTINPTEMEQVLVNLISNAIEASQAGDSVTVRAELASEEAVRVLVEDSGCGMSKEEAEHVFDPFFSTRKDAGGTGLGLSIVHGIVEEHGGTIRVESRPGEGSTFTLELPVPSA